MQIQVVTFDRVYDVYKGSARSGLFTQFGFELDGKRNNSGYIHLHADLVPGKKLALAMLKPNEWGSIYGVADYESGKLYVDTSALASIVIFTLFGVVAQVAVAPLVFLNWPDFTTADRCWSIAALLFLALLSCANVLKAYRFLLAARLLGSFVSVSMRASSAGTASET